MPSDDLPPLDRHPRTDVGESNGRIENGDPSMTMSRDAAYLASFPERNPNPIVEADLDGRIRYANPASLRLFPGLCEQGAAHAWLADWATVTRPFREGHAKSSLREVTVGDCTYQQAFQYLSKERLVRIYGLNISGQIEVGEQLRLLSAAMEAAANGVVITDREGQILWVNPAFSKLTGYGRDEAIGQNPRVLKSGLQPPEFYRQLWETILRGEPWHGQLVNRRKDDMLYTEEMTITPVRAQSKAITHFVAIKEDITSRKRAEEELRQAKVAAEAANVAKSQFLANMSHELRTPMNAVLGMTDLALSEPLSPAVRDCLLTARESANSLLELLNQILDFSRIDAGKMACESVAFDLHVTLRETLKSLAVSAHEKGLELICHIPSNIPAQLVGDPLRLRQVLVNLIGNAVKFTEHGEVLVRAALRRQGTQHVRLEFAVADTGIGISPQDQERIFAPFRQADASTTRRYGGSGLGLAIAHSLIRHMGGRLWVRSKPGGGSTFHFTLRLGLPPGQASTHPSAMIVAPAEFHDVPVLIIDQNRTRQRMLRQLLTEWRMNPEIAPDTPTAMAKLAEAADAGRRVPLVLADFNSVGETGVALPKPIQSGETPASKLILLCSPVDRHAMAKCCEQLGALRVEKPVSRSALLAAIANALGAAVPSNLAGAEPQPAADRPLARPLRILLAEDTPAGQKVVVRILSKRGHTVVAVADGRETVEQLTRGDFDLILMDVQMPVMDGFQATAAIRALQGEKARLPIVALTAHAMSGDEQRCLQAGMDAYLPKPINPQGLIDLVERLGNRGVAREATCETPAATTSPVDRGTPTAQADRAAKSDAASVAAVSEVFNVDEAMQRCFGQHGMFVEMVGYFVSETPGLLEKMRSALRDGKGGEVASAAHQLRGTVLYLGARDALQAATALEAEAMADQLTSAEQSLRRLEDRVEQLKQALLAYCEPK
jgi:PAS domain S-box-containing protein